MVVVASIAILIALLFPALSRTRKASTQVACISNLRQWALATQMYAIENHGYLPRRGQGVAPTVQIDRQADWFNVLPPMLQLPPFSELSDQNNIPHPGGANSVWLCPDAADFDGKYYWSYGMNMGLSVETGSQNGGMPDKISSVGDTSVMALFADGPGN